MATSINWIATPLVVGSNSLSAANPTYDGSGTVVTVVPTVSVKTAIYVLDAIATGATNAAGGLLYWVRVNGANRWLEEVSLIRPSITPSATTLPERITIVRSEFNPVLLEVGDSLAAYVTVANPFSVRAYGGVF